MPTLTIDVEAETADAQRDLNNLGNTAGPGLGGKLKSATQGMADFKAGLDLAMGSVGTAKEVFDATIGKAAEYGDAMGDLAAITGATVEETSLMVSSFELVGVGVGSIEGALKKMTANGMAPNLETMKALAKQYQAIQDPIKKNEFLFKNFGSAGKDLAEIMGTDEEMFGRLETAARSSGKVIGEDTAEAASEAALQIAMLQQKMEGLAIFLGNTLIPTFNDFLDTNDELKASMLAAQGIEMATVSTKQETARAIIDMTNATIGMSAATSEAKIAADDYAGPLNIIKTESLNYAQASKDATQALADLQAKQDGWASSTGQDVINALKDAGVEGREYEQALLGIDTILGTTFAQDEEKQKKLDAITLSYKNGELSAGQFQEKIQALYGDDMPRAEQSFDDFLGKSDHVVGGFNSLTTSAALAAEQANAVTAGLLGIPAEINSRIVITTYEQRAAAGGHEQGEGPGTGGYSHGANFIVPPGYPNDSYPMWVESGEHVKVTPANQVNIGAMNVNGAKDPGAVAREIVKQIDEYARGKNATLRTGGR